MAKNLEVNVVVKAKTKELDRMFDRINNMTAKVNQQTNAQDAVTRAVNKTNTAHKKQRDLIDDVTSAVKGLAKAYLGVMAAQTVVNSSDTITSAENKLNHLNATALGSAGYTTDNSGAEVYSKATLDATQQTMDKMYTSAQKVRMGYADMMGNVSKSMTLAGKAFGGNIDNAIRFQEVMAEAYTLSGSSAAEMHSSMYQMIQGLGSGVLQGDELRSVREGASMAYQAIEKYAQGVYKTELSLKDLASQGKITSDIVVAAVLDSGEKMDSAFAKTSMTFAQAWTKIKNTALKAFEPALQKLNEALQKFSDAGAFEAIGMMFKFLGFVLTGVAMALGWVADNLYWLQPILTAVGLIVTIVAGKLLFMATSARIMGLMAKIAGNQAFMAWLKAAWPLFLIIAIIAIVIACLSKLGISFSDVCGYIAGAVWVVISFIITLVKSLWNYLKAVATNIGIAMSNPWEAAKAAFWGWIADVLEGIRWLEPALNAIAKLFGADGFTLSGTIDAVKAKQQASLDKLNYVDTNAAFMDTWSDWSVKGAFETGKNWGSEKATGLTDKISELLNVGGLPDSGINPTLDSIDGNTGKMADSMQLAEEDLAYLRDVANMEWKKEFTTATIKVDMTNNNSVSNDFDLNSLAIGLRDLVEEEMYAVANGVYV